MRKKVVIIGGGVAGLSAAHELAERDFDVEVYESKDIPGGKARSIPFYDPDRPDSKGLPGEHGFRLFPRFYKHVIDTMKRIPYDQNTVYDNLVEVSRVNYAQFGKSTISTTAKLSFKLKDLLLDLKTLLKNEMGFTFSDILHVIGLYWKLATTSQERLNKEYQKKSWWDFVEADQQSPGFRKFFVALTKTLTACKADVANAKTVGTVSMKLLTAIVTPGFSYVRILNGPTNDKWINPWLTYLQNKGVGYHENISLRKIQLKNGEIHSVLVEGKDSVQTELHADYFIFAIPVEKMAEFITEELTAVDPKLAGIPILKDSVDWMNGIQFYLKKDIRMSPGHFVYMDSPWGLTSISQKQFWPDYHLPEYKGQEVKGVLSVDISDWDSPYLDPISGKQVNAKELPVERIADLVWEQIIRSVNVDGKVLLHPDDKITYFLDPDIIRDVSKRVDAEVLLVNKIGSWDNRPDAVTQIPNMFLASDYVKTITDLASMEAANEAARHAVNGILKISGSDAPKCQIWEVYSYSLFGIRIFAPFQRNDERRYIKGLPWNGWLF